MIRAPRLGTAILGAGLAIAGIAVALVPDLGIGVPETYLVVLAVGAVALLAGLAASAGIPVGRTAADLPPVENRLTVPAPGDEFDDDLAGLPARRTRGSAPTRRRIRDRLEAAATAALVREGLDRETARARLVDGSWTDDPQAAAFFRGDSPSRRERIDRYARGESPFAKRARATARAVARRLHDSEATAATAGPVLTTSGGRLGPDRAGGGSGAHRSPPAARGTAVFGDDDRSEGDPP